MEDNFSKNPGKFLDESMMEFDLSKVALIS